MSPLISDIVQGVMAVLVGGGLVTGVVAWRKDRRQAPKDEAETFTAWQAASRASAEEASAAREAARKAQNSADQALRELAALRREVADLRHSEGQLLGWIASLHAGIEAGTIPPLPVIPAWLVEAISRVTSGKHRAD